MVGLIPFPYLVDGRKTDKSKEHFMMLMVISLQSKNDSKNKELVS